jgi:sialate O-acetylesterase
MKRKQSSHHYIMKFRIIWLLRRVKLTLLSALLFFLNLSVSGEVRLPYVLSDNMVLQRGLPVNIWGWANPGEKVLVVFNNQKISAKAAKDGAWKVQLAPLAAGGPFEMTIQGKNVITLKNILVGDVWVCGGQSNMEWSLSNSRNWAVDQNSVENQNLRLFYVPKNISTTPLDNTLEAKWEICDRETAARFSAVGYYFGRNLEKELNVPIGLINNNWGGTGIETWTSLETMYADEDYKATVEKVKSIDTEQLRKEAETNRIKYQNTVDNEDPGIINKWYSEDSAISDWETMKLPQAWEGAGLPSVDGVVWFAKEIIIDPADAGKEASISLGPVDDSDITWLNGVQIGKTENRAGAPRLYKVPSGVLLAGKNKLTVKVIDRSGRGGLLGKDEEVFIEVEGKKKGLAGNWFYKVGLKLPAFKDVSNPNTYPSLLYNGMINPITKYPIKGVIWYQGENNVGRHIKYRSQFPAMIKDWRQKWNCGDFTFLFVQLANFTDPVQAPQNSSWAGVREAQSMALSVPNTGMAVIIDIGEAKDIHPRNKDDVGYRLALAALKKAYGKDLVYSGPVYKSMKVEGDRIVLEFDHNGSGLWAKDKYGYLKSFAIAGADKKFVWAKASLTLDNKVIVTGEGVKNPVAVRYAWADNPDDANLYNKDGLPASPFRTDDW